MSNVLEIVFGTIAFPRTLYPALDPSSASSGLSFSDANNTAETTSLPQMYALARSTNDRASGKYYMEMLDFAGAGSAGKVALGLVNSSMDLTGASEWLGRDTNGVGWQNGSAASIWLNGSSLGTSGVSVNGFTSGSTVAMAVDLDNHNVWFKNLTDDGGTLEWNDSGSADPASNIGGFSLTGLSPDSPLFVCIGLYAASDIVQVNFGATSFHSTPPSGFSPWGG